MRYEALSLGWGYHAWALGSIELRFLRSVHIYIYIYRERERERERERKL